MQGCSKGACEHEIKSVGVDGPGCRERSGACKHGLKCGANVNQLNSRGMYDRTKFEKNDLKQVFVKGAHFDLARMRYYVDNVLGDGPCPVFEVHEAASGQRFAAKCSVDLAALLPEAISLLELWNRQLAPSMRRNTAFFPQIYGFGHVECQGIQDHFCIPNHEMQEPNVYVMVMERAAMGTLEDARHNAGDELEYVAWAIACAMNDVHACGFLHADLKPRNVLLQDGGIPLLCDFGPQAASLRSSDQTSIRY